MANLGEFEVAAREANPDREPDTFTLCGETFTVSDQVGIVPLGMFAKAAVSGLDTAEMDGLAAIIDMVSQSVIEEDRARLLDVATRNRVDADLLLKIVKAVIEAQTGRPTERPSDSSEGSSPTGPSLRAVSSFEDWQETPLGRRELAASPERFADLQAV